MELFALGGRPSSRAEISDWLKRDDDPAFRPLSDHLLAVFLNGLIARNRGKKEGVELKAEDRLNNNIIFRKLRIALNLRDDEILDLIKKAGFVISRHELSAFFRSPEQSQYRPCKDQILRYFLNGLQLKHRPQD